MPKAAAEPRSWVVHVPEVVRVRLCSRRISDDACDDAEMIRVRVVLCSAFLNFLKLIGGHGHPRAKSEPTPLDKDVEFGNP